MGVPLELKGKEMITFAEASSANSERATFHPLELAKEIGWSKGE